MRLLNAKTRLLEEFMGDEGVPKYAILSHTWGKPADEVKLQDLIDINVRDKVGYQKIDYCCLQALKEGIEWVWIDTCCIDKSSTAELSEAINSMFQWYQNAVICYAYLDDVPDDCESADSIWAPFTHSRCFTRGWTLQELLAPDVVRFYSQNWHPLGMKHSLAPKISNITRIETEYLRLRWRFFFNPLSIGDPLYTRFRPNVAQVMSWAAHRKTTRVEDVSYCLLGLFGINMPLLYGEGEKAFFRLQEEILKNLDDNSLFAWGITDDKKIQEVDLDMLSPVSLASTIVPKTSGMFARSPADFRNCSTVVNQKFFMGSPASTYSPPPSVVHRGVRIYLPTVCSFSTQSSRGGHNLAVAALAKQRIVFALIACGMRGEISSYLAVPLVPLREHNLEFGRYGQLVKVPKKNGGLKEDQFVTLHVNAHWDTDWTSSLAQ